MLQNLDTSKELLNMYLPPNICFGCFDYKFSYFLDFNPTMELFLLYDIWYGGSSVQLKLYFGCESIGNPKVVHNAFLNTIEISSNIQCTFLKDDNFRFHINNIIGGTQSIESLIHAVNISLNVFFGGNTFNLEPQNVLSFLQKDSLRLKKLDEIKKDFK